MTLTNEAHREPRARRISTREERVARGSSVQRRVSSVSGLLLRVLQKTHGMIPAFLEPCRCRGERKFRRCETGGRNRGFRRRRQIQKETIALQGPQPSDSPPNAR